MVTKAGDLTPVAQLGYDAPVDAPCPYYDSSANGMTWLTGRWLKATGRPAPRDVRMSRGYTVRVNDMLVSAKNPNAIERIN